MNSFRVHIICLSVLHDIEALEDGIQVVIIRLYMFNSIDYFYVAYCRPADRQTGQACFNSYVSGSTLISA
jgi:hypothetical protein